MEKKLFSNTPIIKKNIEYNQIEISKYQDMFLGLVSQGKIIGNFISPNWQIYNKLNDYPMEFNFDIEIYKELNEALKAFTILNLSNDIATQSIYNDLARLKKLILKTNGFENLRNLELYLEELENKYINEAYILSISIKKFINFYPINNHTKILEICNKTGFSRKKNQRELPNFDDVMKFDYIVNDYFQNHPEEETVKYIPIIVWWLVTNILPLRPSEFLMIRKDCLIEDSSALNPYKIVVPRLKVEMYYDIVDIDESAFKFMKKAISLVNNLDPDSEDLFPTSLIFKFSKIKNSTKKNTRINIRDFGTLKESFYKEIVEEKYRIYNLEKIKSGDTRHFAIINMALQGFNMLSIARMAGHDDLNTQSNYYSHAEHFAQSYVYKLAQFKIENKINLKMDSGITGWKRYVYEKGKIYSDFENREDIMGKIDYGLCSELKSEFPNNCIENCKYCDKFIFAPAINERDAAIQWLTDSSTELENKIRESLELMKDLSDSLASRFKPSNYDLLKITSKKLRTYMDQKVNVEVSLMEANKYE